MQTAGEKAAPRFQRKVRDTSHARQAHEARLGRYIEMRQAGPYSDSAASLKRPQSVSAVTLNARPDRISWVLKVL